MPKRRREPEVIVFEQPTFKKRKEAAEKERQLCRSANVSELFSGGRGGKDQQNERKRPPEELDFKATLREVQKYASSGLTGRDRRRYEEEQIIALGGKPSKRQKMPYPLYQERVKAKREKEQQRAQELRLAGMEVKKRRRERRQTKGRGRWKDNSKGLAPHIGVFQGGAVRLSRQDVARMTSDKRKH